MKDTIILFKNVIRHPRQTVVELNAKSWKLYIFLFLINGVFTGWLFFYSKFFIDPFSWLSLLGGLAVGTQLWSYLGLFQLLYYLISKFLFKQEEQKIKVIGYYFLIAFTLYHLLALVVIGILMPLHQYGIVMGFYNIAHIVLIFWIGALCAQAVQQLCAGTELKTMLKIFPALFGSYALQTALMYLLGNLIIGVAYG
ncbi:MAG: hypothetical protein ACTSRC_09820 [Candidatus Helarchaeota archaeon]